MKYNSTSNSYKIVLYFIASVWLVNGLLCKVLNLVPRHQEIVGRILSEDYARILTMLIGFSEILMAIWILSKLWPRINAGLQIAIIIIMNILEFILVPDLLMWGRANILFALCFVLLIYWNEFVNRRKSAEA